MQAFSCLMYHNVCADGSLADPQREWGRLSPSIKSYFVEESAFAAQIEALHRAVDIVHLDRVKNYYLRQAPRQGSRDLLDVRPSVLLTFDDGWAGTLDRAAPILQKYSTEATVFVTTGFVDRPGFLRRSNLSQLPPQLQLGSHCRTHRFLNELSDHEIREELVSSKQTLEDWSGRPVDTVSIPNGAVDRRVEQIAVEVGYSLVFTSEVYLNSQWCGPTAIGRAAIRSTTPLSKVEEFATGDYGLESARRLILGLPKRMLGPGRYRRWRAWWLGEQSGQQEMHDLLANDEETAASEHSALPPALVGAGEAE